MRFGPAKGPEEGVAKCGRLRPIVFLSVAGFWVVTLSSKKPRTNKKGETKVGGVFTN